MHGRGCGLLLEVPDADGNHIVDTPQCPQRNQFSRHSHHALLIVYGVPVGERRGRFLFTTPIPSSPPSPPLCAFRPLQKKCMRVDGILPAMEYDQLITLERHRRRHKYSQVYIKFPGPDGLWCRPRRCWGRGNRAGKEELS